jgi:thymidylate kinase
MNDDDSVIGVVGPCAAGKSTLVADLRALGYLVRHIAQEHSYVKDMWKQISNPDFLIYLDVAFEISKERTGTNWSRVIYDNQIERLKHARQEADLYINTNNLTPQQVLEMVLENLQGVVNK